MARTNTSGGGGGGGTINGTIAKFQVAFGTGTDTIGGSNNITWDDSKGLLSLFEGGNGTFLVDGNSQTYAFGGYTGGGFGNSILINNSGTTSSFFPHKNSITIQGNSMRRAFIDFTGQTDTYGDVDRVLHASAFFIDNTSAGRRVFTQSDNGFQVQDVNGVVAFDVNPATSLIDAVSKRIQNILDPLSPQDAVSKAYADALANGLQWKQTVDVATLNDLPTPYIYNNGASGVGATITSTDAGFAPLGNIDGYVVTVGQRILVKNQTDPKQNGIYIFTRDGNGGSIEWQLTRATDDDTQALMKFAAVGVVNNGSQAQTGWTQTNNPGPGPVIGTDNITWVQFLNTVYLPGAGLGLSAHTFFLDTTHPNEWQGTGIQTFDSGIFKLKGSISGLLTISAADTTVAYSLKWPASQGVNRTYLQEDGAGNLAWATAVFNLATGTGLTGGPITGSGSISLNSKLAPMDSLTGNALKVLRVNAGETALEYSTAGAGTVTSITAGTGLTGGTIISSGTIGLANTAVTPGTYTFATVTVDAQGRITSALSGVPSTVTIDTLGAATLNTITDAASVTYDGTANGTLQTITLNRASTALTISNLKIGIPYTFIVKQDTTGGRALTWSTTVKVAYGGAGAPVISTAANAVDKFNFIYDGTTIFVDYANNYN